MMQSILHRATHKQVLTINVNYHESIQITIKKMCLKIKLRIREGNMYRQEKGSKKLLGSQSRTDPHSFDCNYSSCTLKNNHIPLVTLQLYLDFTFVPHLLIWVMVTTKLGNFHTSFSSIRLFFGLYYSKFI